MELPARFDASHAGALQSLLAATLVPDQSMVDATRVQVEACEKVPGYCSLLLVRGGGSLGGPAGSAASIPGVSLCRI